METEKVKNLVELLKSNHNIILHGAPGTGKTYLAKQIASQLIFGKELKEAEKEPLFTSRVGFVQFHPSYDYTDFVEGLRPIRNNDKTDSIGFERRDGVFKEFCKRAIEIKIEIAVREVLSTTNTFFTDIASAQFKANLPEKNSEIHIKTSSNGEFDVPISQIVSVIMSNKFDTYITVAECLNLNKKEEPRASHIQAIAKEVKSQIKDSIKDGYCVFIIDEINRGELSKIFGELFFSIDPGYRGKCGKVNTQYQNLIENNGKDFFQDGFYVPENVYIIGTMNDIDRSVESMDFAFRRRFAFVEIKANENCEMLSELGEDRKEAENKMNTLNNAIDNIEGLSSAYHIGAGYFLKLKNYKGDFNKLWEYHLEGLLREYLRGMTGIKDKMELLTKAYGYPGENK